ncbi:MAG: hypothetical protein ABEL97_07170 [Salinibacter sp.]
MRSWIFSLLTNACGCAPSSKANTRGKITSVYAAREAVCRGLLADLAEANRLIDPGNE